MTTQFGLGSPKLRIYQTDGTTTLKTYLLPVPNKKDGIALTWESNSVMKRKVDGNYVQIFLDPTKRYIPKLTIKYGIYEEFADAYNIGSSDGQTPTFEQLLADLGTYQGRLGVSPGGSAPFFKCALSKNVDTSTLRAIVYKDVTLEFTGTTAYATMTLV